MASLWSQVKYLAREFALRVARLLLKRAMDKKLRDVLPEVFELLDIAVLAETSNSHPVAAVLEQAVVDAIESAGARATTQAVEAVVTLFDVRQLGQ